ncbi:hypothetical protein L1887_53511 [Cichorium endivia]|nr:hypothetical protein L1887_53511 [Cichorium endivia]
MAGLIASFALVLAGVYHHRVRVVHDDRGQTARCRDRVHGHRPVRHAQESAQRAAYDHQHDLPGQGFGGSHQHVPAGGTRCPAGVVDNALAHDGQGQPNETAHSDRTIVLRDATLRWHAAKPFEEAGSAGRQALPPL